MQVLITGGTGFVGRAVLRRLVGMGYSVRLLLRPGPRSPNLPFGVPFQAALASLTDRRGIQASLTGMDLVIHLAGAERSGSREQLQAVDVQGTELLTEAAAQAGVQRILYLSHLGADRSSAYPVLRAKATAEASIRESGVAYTILRSGLAFGHQDHFTTSLAMLLAISPGAFFRIGDGSVRLQPIWVEDLATCIAWTCEEPSTANGIYEIGGPEFFDLNQVLAMVMEASGIRRALLGLGPPYARALLSLLERILPNPPLTTFWMDYLAANRMGSLDTVPRVFGLQPARMERHLGHLRGQRWGWRMLQSQFRQRGDQVGAQH